MISENSREIVLSMLLAIERKEAYSNQLVRDVLDKYDYLDGQRKAFIKRLFEGTLERQIELDYDINQISSIRVNKMKPLIRCLLRMSAYQILFMDSVPNQAAVNEAVKLAMKHKFMNLKGFVNGVLRKLSTDYRNIEKPDETANPVSFLSVNYSMPEWIVKHFLKMYSYEETKNLLDGLLSIRPVCIRFHSSLEEKQIINLKEQWDKLGIEMIPHKEVHNAFYLKHCDNIRMLPGFTEGMFTVQDASSMLAVDAAQIHPNDLILDICAAPGGKTMLAAEKTGNKGHVISRDVSLNKVEIINDNLKRMNLKNVTSEVWDARTLDQNLEGKVDVVLADVPCSGLGVMGKKRDIKYRQTEEALAEIYALQKEIVKTSVKYVKKGGTFLYSTCTINPKENEEEAEFICQEYGFHCEEERQLLPNINDTDGFFFARLIKD